MRFLLFLKELLLTGLWIAFVFYPYYTVRHDPSIDTGKTCFWMLVAVVILAIPTLKTIIQHLALKRLYK